MASGQLGGVVEYLRRMVGPGPGVEFGDGQLLYQFVNGGDQEAFEALVHRHAGLVWGVCRRVLQNAQDAEDAFQATFLVLARSGRSITNRSSLASWLHAVAHRTALRARSNAARRRQHEKPGPDMSEHDPLTDLAWRDLRPVLDAELARLPEKYRAPLILCYFEGKTNEEAARILGWTKGTVSGRLARAREILRSRLTGRGLTLSAGILGSALSQCAEAAVPPPLISCTAKAAVVLLSGQGVVTSMVTAQVAGLAEGVIQAMWIAKLKMIAAVAVCIVAFGASVGYVGYTALAADSNPSIGEAQEAKTPRPAAQDAKPDKEKILGSWSIVSFEENGKKGKPEDHQGALFESLAITFTAERMIMKMAAENNQFLYSLESQRDPKLILLSTLIDNKEKPLGTGVYALEGDVLKLCLSNLPGGESPKQLKTKEGDGLVLFELRRLKPGEDPSPRPDDPRVLAARRKMVSANNMKWIMLAFHGYHDTNGHFPLAAIYSQDGKPLLSWRVMLLPFIEQENLFRQFRLDEPWDSKHNMALLAQIPATYAEPNVKPKAPFATHYQVFTGLGTLFEGSKRVKLADITDGTSNTIMLVEAAEAVPWTKPDDVNYSTEKALPRFGSLIPGGFHIGFCDGSVRFVSDKFEESLLRALISPRGGEVVDANKLNRR